MGQEEALHGQIESDRRAAVVDPMIVQRYRDYAAGKQPVTFTPKQRHILRGILKNTFCDNMCRRIVATTSRRVRFERFDCDDQAVTAYLNELATKTLLPRLANRVHFTAVRDGNTFVSLEYDSVQKRARLKRELSWNGKRGTFMAYDNGEPAYAVKEWVSRVREGDKVIPRTRRVVWYPGRIGRFVQKGSGWEWFPLPAVTDPTGAVLRPAETPDWQPWTDNQKPNGEPIGIPCVHFARMEQPEDASQGDIELSDDYGQSTLDGGVLGIQDAVNDDHWGLIAATRLTAYRIITAKGISFKDSQGRDVTINVEPGTVIHVEDENAEFGTIEAADLSQITNTLTAHLQAGARSTNTPLHYIYGDWPSGEALIQADRPLIDQAEGLADSFGPAWSSVAHLAVKLENIFNRRGLNADALIKSLFRPPDRGDVLSLAVIAEKLSPFVSEREVLRILRYPEDKIDQIIKERGEDAMLQPGPTVPGQSVPGNPGGNPAVDAIAALKATRGAAGETSNG